MANNLVKFVYTTAEKYAAATKDANTIYFVQDGTLYKIYKGDTFFDGTTPDVAAALTALENSLADVATTGAAADVIIADASGKLTATTVEDALTEVATAIENVQAAERVTIESAAGTGNTLTTYDFYQGVLTTDDAAAKASKKIGTINIPKDYLVRSAEIKTVTTADSPYTGAAVGDKYIDFVINTKDGDTGTPDHMYLAVNDLITVIQGSTGAEITVTIGAGNAIQATVNEINGNKVIYEVGTGGAANVTVNAKIAGLEEAIGDGIASLDADVDAAAVPALGADAEAIGVVSGVTEVDGIITAVDTEYVDKAGAATRAKTTLIGTSSDAKTADTIYGAKAYADDAVTTALTWGIL